MDCPCFDLKQASLQAAEAPGTAQVPSTETQWRPEAINTVHVGKWCVVIYDKKPYPGIIMNVEGNSIQVNCMKCNGVNKFYWPGPRKDISRYADQLLRYLQE